MNKGNWFVDFILIFIVTFIVTSAVTLLWSLFAHGGARVDWGTSFRMAIILGVVLPLVHRVGRKA